MEDIIIMMIVELGILHNKTPGRFVVRDQVFLLYSVSNEMIRIVLLVVDCCCVGLASLVATYARTLFLTDWSR